MILEKGGIASVDGIWYVIVTVRYRNGKTGFDCICDHANNIHSWNVEDAQYIASLEEIHQYDYNNGNEKFMDLVRKRKIPYQVITEVLSGKADDRFDHWYENENYYY